MRMFGIARDQAPIEYRERSPLVVPPTRDLPSPKPVAAEAKIRPGRRIRTQAGAKNAASSQEARVTDSGIDDRQADLAL